MDTKAVIENVLEQLEPPSKSPGEYVRTFRHGAIAASVFRRVDSTGVPFMDISLSRAWKNQKTGKEGYSTSFYARNVDQLKAVIDEAASFIEAAELPLAAQHSPAEAGAPAVR